MLKISHLDIKFVPVLRFALAVMTMLFGYQNASACDMPPPPKLNEVQIVDKSKIAAFDAIAISDVAFKGTLLRIWPGSVGSFEETTFATFKIEKCLKGHCGKSVTFKIQPNSDCSGIPDFASWDIKKQTPFWVTLIYSKKLREYVWDGDHTMSVPAYK